MMVDIKMTSSMGRIEVGTMAMNKQVTYKARRMSMTLCVTQLVCRHMVFNFSCMSHLCACLYHHEGLGRSMCRGVLAQLVCRHMAFMHESSQNVYLPISSCFKPMMFVCMNCVGVNAQEQGTCQCAYTTKPHGPLFRSE
jgi:hypothetical protein